MQKSDLVEILKSLNLEEQVQLINFYQNTFGNPYQPAPHALRLTEAIFAALNAGEDGALEKENLYVVVFPNERPIFNKLEKQASLALKIARQYIQLSSVEKLRGEAFEQYLLQIFFREKNLTEAFEQSVQKIKNWQNTPRQWTAWDYCLNWLLDEQLKDYKIEFFDKKDARFLLEPLRALDKLYWFLKTYNTAILLDINRISPFLSDVEVETMVYDIHQQASSPYFSTPTGMLFLKAIDLLAQREVAIEKVTDFIGLLRKNESSLPPAQANHLEVFAINTCIRNIARDKNFLFLNYNILKNRTESGKIYNQGKIAASEFQNIVKTGLMFNDFEWVYNFVEENRKKITGSSHPEELYRYNKSLYLYYTQQYDPALAILLQADYDEYHYKVSSKVLEIQILYETESEVLPAKIDAAKIFFYRDKHLAPARKAQYCGFADFMRRLIRPQTAVNPERIQKLKEELLSQPPIAEWYWLQEKLDELLQRKGRI